MASSPKPRPAADAPSPPDLSDPNAAAKKPVWNRRAYDGSSEAGAVMGASSWPPLSESARSSPKLPDPPAASDAAPLKNPTNRGGGGGPPGNAGIVRPQKSGRRVPNGGVISDDKQQPVVPEKNEEFKAPPRGNRSGGGADHGPRGSQGFGRGDHHFHHHHHYHRGYAGNHRRGGGSHHRRDTDRGNQDWSSHHQGFVPVPQHPQQRPMQRPPFIRAPMQPPSAGPFIGPPSPMQPPHYGAPMGFPEMHPMIFVPAPPPPPPPPTPPDAYRPVPYIAPPPIFVPPDPQTQLLLLKQIEYYFSPENLCKDIFLRNNMNEEGWVPVHLIANFNRVKKLNCSIPFILDAVRISPELEVQGDRIRRRNDWKNWVINTPQFSPSQTSPHSHVNALAANLGNMTFHEGDVSQNNAKSHIISRPYSDPSTQPLAAGKTNGDGTGCITAD